MNQEKPSARIHGYVSDSDYNGERPSFPDCFDVRREMDALHDRVAALEQQLLSGKYANATFQAPASSKITIAGRPDLKVEEIWDKPESEKVCVCKTFKPGQCVRVKYIDNLPCCVECGQPIKLRPESAPNLTAFMKDMNEKPAPAKGRLADILYASHHGKITSVKSWEIVAKAALDEICQVIEKILDEEGDLGSKQIFELTKRLKEELL